jgi:hypothetical protein
MERFVFVVAIVIAVFFGIKALVGDHDWGIHIEGDGGGTAEITSTEAGRLEPEVFAGSSLRVRHTVARVVVTPEDRADIQIEITSPGGVPMPTVELDGDQVTINGHLRGRISNCRQDGTADLRGYDAITPDNLPIINIRAPRALVMERGGAGTTEIAAAESVNFDLMGCGSAIIADVAGELELDMAGSGTVTTGAARTLNLDMAGAGDVTIGAIGEYAQIDMAGAGDVTLASLTGSLNADSSGAGNITIQGGAISVAEVDMAGAGDVNIAAPVQTLNVSMVGAGDLDVANTVGDIDADIAGVGVVSARAVTGTITKDVMGPGDVRVGQ